MLHSRLAKSQILSNCKIVMRKVLSFALEPLLFWTRITTSDILYSKTLKKGNTMGAPSKVRKIQLVEIQPGKRVAANPELNSTYKEVTNYAELEGRMHQAATRMVNVLSPEIFDIVEVDAFHCDGRQHCCGVMVRKQQLYRGLRQQHDARWELRELGRSIELFGKKYIETSRK